MPDVYCESCGGQQPLTEINEVPVVAKRTWLVCDQCIPGVRNHSESYVSTLEALIAEANIDAFLFELDDVRGTAYKEVHEILVKALKKIKKIKVVAKRNERKKKVKTRRPDLFSEE